MKKESGLAGIDVVIAIVALMIFSGLIFSMMYSNVMENVKLKKETLAMIYMTEMFENIGIEDYSNLENGDYQDIGNNNYDYTIENIVPKEAQTEFKVDILITDELENVESNENIMKKIIVTLTYEINNKNYICSMERMKVKE